VAVLVREQRARVNCANGDSRPDKRQRCGQAHRKFGKGASLFTL
jgi:hypothetical protein